MVKEPRDFMPAADVSGPPRTAHKARHGDAHVPESWSRPRPGLVQCRPGQCGGRLDVFAARQKSRRRLRRPLVQCLELGMSRPMANGSRYTLRTGALVIYVEPGARHRCQVSESRNLPRSPITRCGCGWEDVVLMWSGGCRLFASALPHSRLFIRRSRTRARQPAEQQRFRRTEELSHRTRRPALQSTTSTVGESGEAGGARHQSASC